MVNYRRALEKLLLQKKVLLKLYLYLYICTISINNFPCDTTGESCMKSNMKNKTNLVALDYRRQFHLEYVW